jgi:ATP-dependent RNA helicase DeaD
MQNFNELSLSAPILRAITDMGYETPSPIQAQALPILLAGPTDFLGLAGTGTGKTATFAIPLLESINPQDKTVQALILCPTRELAVQVSGQIALLGKHKGVRVVTVYGGASYNDQIRGLRQGATVVVGTPGRVIDHIERGTLLLDQLKVLVLDEADEMLSMGFKEDLEKVIAQAPRESSNIWLFSATMNREVGRVAATYLRSPKSVQVNKTEMLSSGVEQYYYPTMEGAKPELICKLIEAADDFYGLIFCQTKALVADLTSFLVDRGYKVDCLHGDKDQTSRERTMQAFRDRKVSILVCTDVASRGLDVKDITHVINYSLPRELDSYVHRIGRTARSGKTGIAMNLVTNSHRRLIFAIEQMTKSRMVEGQIPSRREIGARKITKLLPRFQDQPFHTRALEILGEEWKAQLATMTPEEVAAHFLTMLMPDVFAERDAAPARSVKAEHAGRPPMNRAERAPRSQPSYGSGPSTSRPSPTSPAAMSAVAAIASKTEIRPVVPEPSPVQASVPVPVPVSVPAPEQVSIREEWKKRADTNSTTVKKAVSKISAPKTSVQPRAEKSSVAPKPFAAKKGAKKTTAPVKSAGTKSRDLGAKVNDIPLLSRRARRAEKFGVPLVPRNSASSSARDNS